jgi:hypothetical protein
MASTWAPTEISTPRKVLRLLRRHWKLVVLTAILLGGSAALRATLSDQSDSLWHNVRLVAVDVGLAVGGALVVALVIGFLIDVEARFELAKEIAEGWLWGLLGPDAPERLQLRAKEVIGKRVVLGLDETTVHLSWVPQAENAPKTLHVAVQSLLIGTNFGPEPWRKQPSTRVIPSLPGYTSKVTKWEFDVQRADPSMPAGHVLLREDELNVQTFKNLGTIHVVDGGDLDIPVELSAHRGDRFRLFRCGELWLSEADTLPLSTRVPAVDARLVVRGDALADLDVQVLSSTLDGAPSEGSLRADGSLVFEGSARLGGEWWWLCWTPKSAPKVEVSENGERS